jgi:hypothetical protein
MTEQHPLAAADAPPTTPEEPVVQSRRDFLISLGKWSTAVVTGAVLGAGLLAPGPAAQAGVWINNRGGYGGGGWVNHYGGGGGGWINNRGGGGGWINNRGGGGGWINR